MDKNITKVFFDLLKSAVTGGSLSEEELKAYSPDILESLIEMSAKHDVTHLLALGMKQNGLLPKKDELGIGNFIFNAVLRVEKIKSEFEVICKTLENKNIPFLPLKGSVIRAYYPEDWMRTSCDIDILVHEADIQKATDVLVSECGCRYSGKGSHNASLFAPNNTHIELHFVLVEKGLANEASAVLENVWDTVKLKEGSSCWYEMPDEMFYFYHIAHMAKHFENGGCGIRPFIDLKILEEIKDKDIEKRNRLLEEGKLLRFADSVRKLSNTWFGDSKHSGITIKMEEYILKGGVFGSKENKISVKQQKKGGKLKYALSKIFIPYDEIKFHYPVLQKKPYLTPVMQVRRWGKLIFCGHLKRTSEELKYNNSISKAEGDNVGRFLIDIGLKDF